MSRILFDAFDGAQSTVSLSVAVDASAEFVASASIAITHSLAIEATATDEFVAAASITVGSAIAATVAVDATSEFVAAATVVPVAAFIPPETGYRLVATVSPFS